jgi:3-methyladenine DNA glycosylase AlkD
MNIEEVMKQLEAAGSEQTRKTYRRHGVQNEMFGVSFAHLGALTKKIKSDHQLALKLWASGNHDAQILATMVADAKLVHATLLEEWAKSLNNYPIADAFAKLAAQTPLAQKKFEKWMKARNEWLSYAGWLMLAQSVKDQELPDSYFENHLATIGSDIHAAQNRVKHAMNMALIAIGTRNDNLQKQALAMAKRIGKVVVDHGDTSCKTPDAADYILKVTEHKKKSATKG